MVELIAGGVYYIDEKFAISSLPAETFSAEEGRKKTIAYGILKEHNILGDMSNLKIRFDSMASHDITYVNIIQTARASGLPTSRCPMC